MMFANTVLEPENLAPVAIVDFPIGETGGTVRNSAWRCFVLLGLGMLAPRSPCLRTCCTNK